LYAQVLTWAEADQIEHKADAAAGFDSLIMRYAAWLVRDVPDTLDMSQADIYRAFLGGNKAQGAWDEIKIPIEWIDATGVTVTLEELRKWVRGPGTLTNHLKRLNMAELKHGRNGNTWHFDAAQVRAIAAKYMGEDVLTPVSDDNHHDAVNTITDDDDEEACNDAALEYALS
jgi:hypothetical protein